MVNYENKTTGELKESLRHISGNYDKACAQNIALYYEVEKWKNAFNDLKDRVDGLQNELNRDVKNKKKTTDDLLLDFKEVDTEAIIDARNKIFNHALKIMRERAIRKAAKVNG